VAWSPDNKTVASASSDHGVRLWDAATGTEIRSLAVNHSSFADVAFSPDGRSLASANSDATVLIWEVASAPLTKQELTTTDLARLWDELGSQDATKADRALWSLVAGQKQAMGFLKERLPPVQRDSKLVERLAKLIGELDNDEFKVRERASAELARMGESAEHALDAALAAKPSLEVTKRVESLLEMLDRDRWPGLSLQTWHALAVLERIGNDDAREVLHALAKGDADARLTQEAKAGLKRMQRLKDSEPKQK
jgi:Txe/YoeB family toxin of Txe-Axe toxin-antitoxin module